MLESSTIPLDVRYQTKEKCNKGKDRNNNVTGKT